MKTSQFKRTVTLITVLLFCFELFSQIDNDGTYQTAGSIGLNSAVSGTVGYKINDQTYDYDDWYKFTIPSDGKIEIVESTSSELISGMYVYDVDGTHEFWSKYGKKGGSDTLTIKNLGAGDYYIRINSWNYSAGSYTLSVNFTPALYSNDTETNNQNTTAVNIPINTEITGHVGFYRNNNTDYDDWYKFTIPSDGKIEIVESTSSELISGMYAYDVDGTHEFWSQYGRKGSPDTLKFKNLAAGDYYIRINNWNYSYGSYKLKVNFYPADYSNDTEPNSLKENAKNISINTEITGHVGYYRNSNTDNDDWFKFTIPSDGRIEIVESTSSELISGMYAYDVDGTHEFWSQYGRKGSPDTLKFKNLAAGDYYIRINNWNYSYGSFKLKVNFYPADYSNDTEPNSLKEDAKNITINTEITGHVGYYRNSNTDNDDWFKFTIPSDGKIEIFESPTSELISGMYAYDVNGTHEFYSRAGRKGIPDTLIYKNLGAGEYYIRINNWNYSYGSYKLKVNFYQADYSNDSEPNEVFTKANQLIYNIESTGHVGFYSNDIVDNDDWYWFTLPSSERIKIVENVSKDLNSGIYLFNTNGIHELNSKVGRKGIADTLIYNDVLPAGNYYIRISNWNYSFGSYSLKVSNYNPTSLSEISNAELSVCMLSDSRRLLIKGVNIQNIQILDLFGKIIDKINPVSDKESFEIDMSNCKSGVYIIKISHNEKISTAKIMIR
jgi:hypothetical protein